MKIALVGYGKMGQMIESLIDPKEMQVIARFTDVDPMKNDAETENLIRDAEVLIDFSIPESALANIETGARFGKHMVIGTTGWYDALPRVKTIVEKAGTGIVYASNFSIGVQLFFQIVEKAAGLLSSFNQYDPFIYESHHKMKKDAPSGTAGAIHAILKEFYNREIPVSSIRAGYIPGTHEVGFDSAVDTLVLKHVARNRQGFAQGAIQAAKWIRGHKGLYAFQDIIGNMGTTE